MNSKIILITVLLLCIPLTELASFSTRHFQTTRYNQTAYANELSKRQQQFENTMRDIQRQVTELDNDISKFQGNETYQIMKLQEGLAQERDALYDVENNLNRPFALRPCQKPNLTEQQTAQLNKQIKLTNQSLTNMKSQVKKCTSQSIQQCTVSDQLIHQITRAQSYLSVMDDYVNGKCTRVPKTIVSEKASGLVNLDDRLFKDNLKSPNWIYGNITQEQYRLIVFAQTTKFNMTTCPIQIPFANKINNTCFNCPQGSIFSLGQRICTCPTGYKFDPQSNYCVSLIPIKPCNQTGDCVSMCPKDKPRWNTVNKICQPCPQDKPIVNRTSNTCQSCPQLRPVWNQLTYQCQQCPKNTHFIQNISKCVPCKDDQKYEQAVRKCVPICKQYQIYSKQEGKCYTLEELNGCKCNQRYNKTLKECEDVCQNGLQWLPSQKKCGPPSLPDFKDKCKYYQRFNKQTNECQNYCDSTVAWYDRQNHVCIKIGCSVKCKCGQIFDNMTGKCIPESHQCPPQQFYNTTSQECQIPCANNMVYNRLTKSCETTRITCLGDQIYNQLSKSCVKRCTGSYQTYNYNTLRCQCFDGYHRDPSNQLCVVNSVFCDTSLKQIYSKNQNRCVCMQGYRFNEQNICVSVCAVNQHYDFNTKSCLCDQGYVLNATSNTCYLQSTKCNQALHFVFNPKIKQCDCMNGYKLSPDKSMCLSLMEICLKIPSTTFNSATSMCQCQSGYNAISQNGDNLVCQALCKEDETYNQNTQKCVKLCPDDYYYNTTTHSCVYRCQADYQYNKSTQQCERTVKVCPDPVNQFYDPKSGQCNYCPAGYTLNVNTLLCQKKVSSCAPGQFYDEVQGNCKYCKQGQTYNTAKKVCQFTTTTCAPGMYFDFNLGQCQYCQNGYIYDQSLLQCRRNCSLDQIFDYNKKQCISISSTCNSYQYYDNLQRKCVNKPVCSSVQIYDQTNQKCVDITYITAKTAKNVIHSNFKSYQLSYDSEKARNKYLRDCPQTTPFYSSTLKNCVYCPDTHPYYNLQTQKCQDCGNDKYDSNLKRCINLNQPTDQNTADVSNLDYSLDRLMMNII